MACLTAINIFYLAKGLKNAIIEVSIADIKIG